MGRDELFEWLDDVLRQLGDDPGIRLLDIEPNEDETVVVVDVVGVRVYAWHEEDNGLCIFCDDDGFEFPDDVVDHINRVGDEDDLNWILDGVEQIRLHLGDGGIADYLNHLHDNTG